MSEYGMLGAGRMMEAFGDNPEAYDAVQSDRTKQLIAQMLLSRGMQQPQGQMVGRFYVPPSPLQHIGGLAQALGGVGMMTMADRKRAEMAKAIRGRQDQEIKDFQQQIAPDTVPVVDRGGMQPTSQTFPTTMPPEPRAHAPNVQQMPIDATRAEMPDTFDIDQLQGGPQVGQQEIPKSKADIQRAYFDAMTKQNPRLQSAVKFMAQQQQMAEQKDMDRDLKREGIASSALMRLEQMKNTAALTAMQIDARARAGQDATDLKKALADQTAEIRKMEIASRERMAADRNATMKDIAGMKQEKPLSAKDQQKMKAGHATAWQSLENAKLKSGTALKKVDWITDEKRKDAFNSNYGGYNAYATQLLPGETQDVKNQIESLQQNLKEAGFSIVRANGGIGSMTEREWPIVEQMINSIGNPKIGEPEARRIYGEIKDWFAKKLESAQKGYDMEWSDTPYYQGKGLSKGDIEDGYIYLGGDPANPKSWEKKQ